MTNIHVFKMQFPHGLHIAEQGFAEESTASLVRSDTLMSAICSIVSMVYSPENIPLVLDGVRLSSSTPYIGKRIFFYKPLNATVPPDYVHGTELKKFKRVRYVEQSLFEKILQGHTPDYSALSYCQDCVGEQSFDQEKYSSAFEIPRVVIDRITNATNLFNFGEVHFADNAGLCILAEFASIKAEKVFRTALRVLADHGIGADRANGKGLFTLTEESMSLALPDNPTGALLCGLLSPLESDLALCNIAHPKTGYDIVTRSGWVSGTPHRRQKQRMFAEGSVIATHTAQEKPQGSNHVVLDRAKNMLGFDVYRYGRGLCLPIVLS
jgi:CRISPR type III-A-associated RAMP protein Csm4